MNNQREVSFIVDQSYWDGISIQFSGIDAFQFYLLLKAQTIDWTIFSTACLSRLDICFDRNHLTSDKLSVKEFLSDCFQNLKQTNKNVSLEKKERGLVLRIGNRKSNNYVRIYQTNNTLHFEHENERERDTKLSTVSTY